MHKIENWRCFSPRRSRRGSCLSSTGTTRTGTANGYPNSPYVITIPLHCLSTFAESCRTTCLHDAVQYGRRYITRCHVFRFLVHSAVPYVLIVGTSCSDPVPPLQGAVGSVGGTSRRTVCCFSWRCTRWSCTASSRRGGISRRYIVRYRMFWLAVHRVVPCAVSAGGAPGDPVPPLHGAVGSVGGTSRGTVCCFSWRCTRWSCTASSRRGGIRRSRRRWRTAAASWRWSTAPRWRRTATTTTFRSGSTSSASSRSGCSFIASSRTSEYTPVVFGRLRSSVYWSSISSDSDSDIIYFVAKIQYSQQVVNLTQIHEWVKETPI